MIDLSSIGLQPSEYLEFRKLCDSIYCYVLDRGDVNLFRLHEAFPLQRYPWFELALSALLKNSSLLNGSKGYVAGSPPKFTEVNPDDNIPEITKDSTFPQCGLQQSDNDISEITENHTPAADRKYFERVEYIKNIDYRVYKILSDESVYSPAHAVETSIEKMDKGTTKTILEEFFIEDTDINSLTKTYKSKAENAIIKFGQEFFVDETDKFLFQKYSISSNILIYLFNRSAAYYRLFDLSYAPGYGDITKGIFPLFPEDSIIVSRTPNSHQKINLRIRAVYYLKRYQEAYGKCLESFVSAVLALLNDTSVRKERIFDIYSRYHLDGDCCYAEHDWADIFDYFIETEDKVKYLSYYNIMALRSILENVNDIKYGVSVKRIYKIYKSSLNAFYIESPQELYDFIQKYTGFVILENRVLIHGDLRKAILDYIKDTGLYSEKHLINSYSKRCGGLTELIKHIIKDIDFESIINNATLTSEEKQILSERLAKYEWISEVNAKSIFTDLHDIEDKFTDINMHSLGFTKIRDAYFRHKYQSISDCLLQTEFIGDEIYVDKRKFELNMENAAYSLTVENFERYLQWIPVSEQRYLNLTSPKYKKFAEILVIYRDKIAELCKKQFVTPFSLKNMRIGIPDIDDDYYDLNFYDAMLIASKANHSSIAKHRFYFTPTDLTIFGSTASEFMRYIIYNNGGSASIGEIKAILESEYGIIANMSAIRHQVKSSSIYQKETDTAYLDSEIYREAIRYESD